MSENTKWLLFYMCISWYVTCNIQWYLASTTYNCCQQNLVCIWANSFSDVYNVIIYAVLSMTLVCSWFICWPLSTMLHIVVTIINHCLVVSHADLQYHWHIIPNLTLTFNFKFTVYKSKTLKIITCSVLFPQVDQPFLMYNTV